MYINIFSIDAASIEKSIIYPHICQLNLDIVKSLTIL